MSTMTPTEFASVVGSDGKTVRKFLRSITPREAQPGKGSRWALPATKRDVTKLQKQFNEWSAKQAEERAARAQKAAEDAAAEVVEEELDEE
jgi:hypothetical protein